MTDLVDPYNRIMRAAQRGKGVRLSAEECRKMQFDDAIATHADFLRALHAGEEWAIKESRGLMEDIPQEDKGND